MGMVHGGLWHELEAFEEGRIHHLIKLVVVFSMSNRVVCFDHFRAELAQFLIDNGILIGKI